MKAEQPGEAASLTEMDDLSEADSDSQADSSSGAMQSIPPKTDGGWGWLIVLGGGMSLLLWSGFLKGMGVLLPDVTADLTQHIGATGEVVAMVACLRNLAGPLAGPIGDRFGYRPVTMVMSMIAALGIILSSFARTTVQFSICLAALSGVGFSASFILSKAMIGRYFQRRFALAISLASTGDSLAMIVMAPLVQVLLVTYGWRGALLLYGGLCLHLIIVGALLRDPQSPGITREGYIAITEDKNTSTPKTAGKSLLKVFNLSILTKFAFWSLSLVMIGTYLVSMCWYVYFVPHVEVKGFKPSQAVGFVAAAGVGQIVTKIVVGKLIDHGIVSSRAGLVLCIVVCSAMLAIDPLIHTFWPMIIVTTVFGSFFGLIFCLVDVLAKEMAGIDGLASAFGYIDLIGGITRLPLGFLPGWIYEKTGSYDIAFVLLGGGYLTILLPLTAEWILHRQSNIDRND